MAEFERAVAYDTRMSAMPFRSSGRYVGWDAESLLNSLSPQATCRNLMPLGVSVHATKNKFQATVCTFVSNERTNYPRKKEKNRFSFSLLG
jgi:hypothetical protein